MMQLNGISVKFKANAVSQITPSKTCNQNFNSKNFSNRVSFSSRNSEINEILKETNSQLIKLFDNKFPLIKYNPVSPKRFFYKFIKQGQVVTTPQSLAKELKIHTALADCMQDAAVKTNKQELAEVAAESMKKLQQIQRNPISFDFKVYQIFPK